MAFDAAFFSSTPAKNVRRDAWVQPRNVGKLEDFERVATVRWIDSLARWTVAFDFTFGTGVWQGRRHGRRKDLRDGLLVVRKYKRGFDADDALDLFRKFMTRVSPETSWFAAIEPNRDPLLNPGFHGHSLLACADEIYRKPLHDRWQGENGWSKVNVIRSQLGRQQYCTKHLVGRGLIFGYEIKSCPLFGQVAESAL